jgi:hypothetical protein
MLKMSHDANLFTALTEMTIPCPVCSNPCIFIQGNIDIDQQLSFNCYSKKCRGKRRYINKDHLQKIIDNFNSNSI